MKRLLVVMLITLTISGVSGVVAKGRSSNGDVTGTMALRTSGYDSNPTPTAGQYVYFNTWTSPLPTNGGASILPYVELDCTANGVAVYSDTESANLIIPTDPDPKPGIATFVLDSPAWDANALAAGSCDAYLFFAGANRPYRTAKNTLAALFNIPVAAGQ